MIKKLMALVLALSMALTAASLPAMAQAPSASVPTITTQATGQVCTGIEEAAAALRSQMVARQEHCTVLLQTKRSDFEDIQNQINLLAVQHTGKPMEGDYLKWNLGDCEGDYQSVSNAGGYLVTFTYEVSYLTTARQEAEVDRKLDEILASLHLEGKSDHEKIRLIYEWIYANIPLESDSIQAFLQPELRTAYHGLFHNLCVCTGLSEILYAMLLKEGIDGRIIWGYSGPVGGGYANHTWNIAKVGSAYYNLDVTWDRSLYESSGVMRNYCLLRGEKSAFSNNGTNVHIRSGAKGAVSFLDLGNFASEEFYRQYPMHDGDYSPKNNVITLSGKTLKASAQEQSFTLKPSAQAGSTLTFSSDAQSKGVSVSSTGKVTVKGGFVGTAKITVKATHPDFDPSGKSVTVKVEKASGNGITVSGKTLKKNKKKDQSFTLKASAKRSGSTLTFRSSVPKKVTVSAKGKVVVKKGYSGTAKITVTATHPLYATVTKTVKIVVK